MKKGLYIAIALVSVALVLVSSCTEKPVPLEDRHATDDLIQIPDPVFEEEKAVKCDLNGILYYVKGHFTYHINDRGDEVVFSPVGTYTKYNGRERWTLHMYTNRESSIYVDTLQWISVRKFPNDQPIECIDTGAIPRSFEEFYASHEKFFKNENRTALDTIETELGGSEETSSL